MFLFLSDRICAEICPWLRREPLRDGAFTRQSRSRSRMIKPYQHKQNPQDDIAGIRDFIAQHDIVERGDELYAIVSVIWPELLHKVKPPRSQMH